MERKELLKFAKIAATTYEDPKTSRDKFKAQGYDIVEFFDIKDAEGYLLKSQDEYVLSFRGTSSASDAIADLKARMRPESEGAKVHRGFKGELDKLWPSIEKSLAGVDHLYVTGHSLGAAMTTIMANRCHCDNTMPDIAEVYTYGSPRVGNNSYVCTFPVIHHRWVNNNDIVCRVPLAIMGYKHDGTMHYLNTWGNVRNPTGLQMFKDRMRGMWRGLKQGKIDNFGDHSITEYIKHLENYSQGKETERV